MAKIKGSSRTEVLPSSTTLLSATNNPIGTIFSAWHGSRNQVRVDADMIESLYYDNYNDSLLDHKKYKELSDYLRSTYSEYCDTTNNCEIIIESVLTKAIETDTPVSEFVSLEFVTDNATVAWRDQLVRNRRIHAWVQSSRPSDLTTFDCSLPESVESIPEAKYKYVSVVNNLRDTYKELIELGVPSEDIRLFPQSMTHRCYWGTTLREVLKLIKRRSSWIAQASYWNKVNSDVSDILHNYLPDNVVDKFLGDVEGVTLSNGKVISYSYDLDNIDRYNGVETVPCDPLWLSYKKLYMPENTDIYFYDRMKSVFIKLWKKEILDLLGWDRYNPDKIGPYDRPYKWFESNNYLNEDIIKLNLNNNLKEEI